LYPPFCYIFARLLLDIPVKRIKIAVVVLNLELIETNIMKKKNITKNTRNYCMITNLGNYRL